MGCFFSGSAVSEELSERGSYKTVEAAKSCRIEEWRRIRLQRMRCDEII